MAESPLAFTTTGDPGRPPLVFLHGLLGAGDEWDDITAQVTDSYWCLQLDLPGHGKSRDCSPALYPMAACAEAVIDVLDSVNIGRAGLCGYSMGGRLAFYLVTHYPDRFTRALVESASPGLRTAQERIDRLAHDEELARRLERDGVGPFLIYWYRQPLFASLARDPDRLKAVTGRRLDNDPHCAARSLRLMGTGAMPDCRSRLAALDIPLLLVTGELDAKFTAIAAEIVDLCPTATHRILENCGHNTHIERPQQFLELLTSFFQ